jgi:hypothetical protein
MKVVAWAGAAFVAFCATMMIALGVALSSSAQPSFASGGGFKAGDSVANLSPEQLANATIALRVADRLHAPPLAVTAEMVAALGESNFNVVSNGQGSGYCGVFQASPANIACSDTEQQAHSFLAGGLGFQAGGAIAYAHQHPGVSPGTVAYHVEGDRSNFSSDAAAAAFYDVHLHDAQEIISAWRSGSSQASPLGGGESVSADGAWLATVPGTALQCDRRIVPDVVMLIERYHLTLTACYAPTGHEPSGEHPLGLAVDVVPAPPATWAMLGQLASDAGWRPACAATGCASQTHTVFRFVGWNGYPGHGDPAHAGGNAHLHLSWNHGPGRPASSVQVLSG